MGNKSVYSHRLAVSDSEEEKTLFVNRNVDANSLLKSRQSGLSSDNEVENRSIEIVPSTTLDNFCLKNAIANIDILKMDIQGGELTALKGAVDLLTTKKIKTIFSEVFFVEQYESQPLFHDISKFLYDNGFLIQDVYSPFYGNGCLAWADAIFVLDKK